MVVMVIVLVMVFVGSIFVYVLQQVVNGSYLVSVMFQVFGLNMFDGLFNLLLLFGYVGVLWVMGWMYCESEMYVLVFLGMGVCGLFCLVVMLVVVIVLVVGLVLFWLGLWVLCILVVLIDVVNCLVIVVGFDVGCFIELLGKDGVIFVDIFSCDGSQLGKIFIVMECKGGDGLIYLCLIIGMCGQFYQESDGNGCFFGLIDGWQYELLLGVDNWWCICYECNDVLLINVQGGDSDDDFSYNLDMIVLVCIDFNEVCVELVWCIGLLVMVLVLMMLLLLLVKQNLCEVCYGWLLLVVFVFFFYYNLLVLCNGQISKGYWYSFGLMWVVSVLVFVIGVWMFCNQYQL